MRRAAPTPSATPKEPLPLRPMSGAARSDAAAWLIGATGAVGAGGSCDVKHSAWGCATAWR